MISHQQQPLRRAPTARATVHRAHPRCRPLEARISSRTASNWHDSAFMPLSAAGLGLGAGHMVSIPLPKAQSIIDTQLSVCTTHHMSCAVKLPSVTRPHLHLCISCASASAASAVTQLTSILSHSASRPINRAQLARSSPSNDDDPVPC